MSRRQTSRRAQRNRFGVDGMLIYRRVRRGLVTNLARLLRQEIAIGLIVFLAAPFGGSVSVFAQQTVPTPQISGTSSSQPPSQNPATENEKPANGTSQNQENNPSNVPRPAQEQQQGGAPVPLGTAVAPYEKGIGVAASRPAGSGNCTRETEANTLLCD